MTDKDQHRTIALTPRQWEVLQLLLQGRRVSSIAQRLGVTTSTIRNHLSATFTKFGVRTQSELIDYFRDRESARVTAEMGDDRGGEL